MATVRERAEEILREVPEPPRIITSNGATAQLFTKLTGVKHQTLVDAWAKGSKLTTCNAFTGYYGTQLGCKPYLGRFDLDTYLPKIGKGHAWIKSTADRRPKYGDICRHTAFHVGVSLDFNGDNWNHVDSGQGGSKAGCDIIKRIYSSTPYDHKKLMGWIDIELYLGDDSSATAAPPPDWLRGWWTVTWRYQTYYYYFDKEWHAQWTQFNPPDLTKPPVRANDTASVKLDPKGIVTLTWSATGSVEKLNRPLDDDESMSGTWNDSENLSASKM